MTDLDSRTFDDTLLATMERVTPPAVAKLARDSEPEVRAAHM
jgi:hypothetical protein